METPPTRAPRGIFDRLYAAAEAVAWSIAVVCLVGTATAWVDSAVGQKQALQTFAVLQAAAAQHPSPSADVTLWSQERIKAWQATQASPGPVPLAVLRVPRIHLEVPILEGTDEITLNRGVGHIEDTAMPGMDGNTGIAGHRDGFFRGLKDVAPGDVIELETLQGTLTYRIERTWIVNPEDVSVLDPTPARSLTLVTCYPFYFVGSAPKRFIVRAVLS